MWETVETADMGGEIPVRNPDGSFDDSVILSMEDVEEERATCLVISFQRALVLPWPL